MLLNTGGVTPLSYHLTDVEIVTFPIPFRHELPLNESYLALPNRLVTVLFFLRQFTYILCG